ncbi:MULTISPECIES: J domain-containing protein [Spirulina sp. CCY15215]|uniref:DnaJ C-terminal domain-containing protein n=1 Tax=Spirulina sp. CCY15215 TaxID=2767591 RepID=UPI00194F0D40|nr:J domain-containing protein [Spirulina major]
MQNFRDYYRILDVETNASGVDVKQSFRRLARRYHPDMNPGDKVAEDRFKEINEAYEVLSDPYRRSQYDNFSRYWDANGQKRKSPRKAPPKRDRQVAEEFDPKSYKDFDRFVEDLINRSPDISERPPASARVDPRAKDAFRPGVKKTEYTVRETDNNATKKERPRNIEAKLTLPLEKAYSGGKERIRLEDGRSLEVEMPPAIVNGQKIRLRGQGMNGGDLYLKMTVEPHAVFEVQGADIFCQVPLTPSEAVLGGLVEVPTLDGLVKMNVPAGVRSGKRLRLANKGYPRGNSSRGDQLVEIQVIVPTDLSTQEKELYEKLRQTEVCKPRQAMIESLLS